MAKIGENLHIIMFNTYLLSMFVVFSVCGSCCPKPNPGGGVGVLIGELAGQCGLEDETIAGSNAVQSGQFQLGVAPRKEKSNSKPGKNRSRYV